MRDIVIKLLATFIVIVIIVISINYISIYPLPLSIKPLSFTFTCQTQLNEKLHRAHNIMCLIPINCLFTVIITWLSLYWAEYHNLTLSCVLSKYY